MPSPQEFFLELPLYQRVDWEREAVFSIAQLLFFPGTIDCSCSGCGQNSTFHSNLKVLPSELTLENYRKQLQLHAAGVTMRGLINDKPEPPLIKPDVYQVTFSCGRVSGHKLRFIYLVQNENIVTDVKYDYVSQWLIKIGQYPSIADLHIPEIQKYRSHLSKDVYADLSRGIGLAAHDVGIGAYVYLRRVFERLIDGAHSEAVKNPGWDEVAYTRMRMPEKVLALQTHLPKFLVDHPEMYALLSKGLHELSEAECLKHFSALRVGIELILDQQIEDEARKMKIAEASKAIKAASSDIGGRG